MRRPAFFIVLSSLFSLHVSAFVGCGGSTTDDVFGVPAGGKNGNDASGADAPESVDASGEDAGQPGRDAGRDARPDAPAPLTCEQLRDQIDAARAKLIECKPGALNQCNKHLEDVCCDLTITGTQAGTQAGTRFKAAVDAFKSAKCVAQCTDIACRASPSNFCVPGGLGGTCLQ